MFFVGGGVGSDLWHRLGKSGNSGRAGHDNNGINFNKKMQPPITSTIVN